MSDNKKQNKPNVPNLRFPEFSGEWKIFSLGDLCSEFQSGKGIKANSIKENAPYPVYGGNGLRGYSDFYNHDGDYSLIGRQGAKCGNVRLVSGRSYITEHAIAIKANSKNNTEFLTWLLVQMNLGQYSDQSAQPGLAVNKLVKLKAFVPDLNEQTKIARLLTLLNNRIVVQNKVIEKYESLIKALTQQAHKRATSSYFLRDVLAERKELNSKGFDICSVSVSKGVINQIEYLGRSFAAKETKHYHVVRHGDVVYTKSPTGDFPYGIIKQNYNENPVAVSPLYGVYEPITYEVGVYLHYYFCSPNNALNYLHPLIQKGAKNTINITNQHFLDNKVRIPDSKVLSKTVSTIITISSRLQLEERLLCQLQLQKQFVLSNMFI